MSTSVLPHRLKRQSGIHSGIHSIMAASAKCSHLSLAYAQCITNNYHNISLDACASQFLAFKECTAKHLKRSW